MRSVRRGTQNTRLLGDNRTARWACWAGAIPRSRVVWRARLKNDGCGHSPTTRASREWRLTRFARLGRLPARLPAVSGCAGHCPACSDPFRFRPPVAQQIRDPLAIGRSVYGLAVLAAVPGRAREDLLPHRGEGDLGVVGHHAGRLVDAADDVLEHRRRRPQELAGRPVEGVHEPGLAGVLPGMPVTTVTTRRVSPARSRGVDPTDLGRVGGPPRCRRGCARTDGRGWSRSQWSLRCW